MARLPNWLRGLFWVIAGAVGGCACGTGFAMGLGLYYQWTHPNDPSAGSVAIVGMCTVPLGILFGMLAGVFYAARLEKRGAASGFDVIVQRDKQSGR
jgi:hypothetical protein